MTKASALEILSMPMEQNEVNAKTLWEYLIYAQFNYLEADKSHELNSPVVLPFFPAYWYKQELVYNLVLNGHVSGNINDQGYLIDYNAVELENLFEILREHLLSADITTLQQIPEPKEYALLKLSDNKRNPEPGIADNFVLLMTKEKAEKELQYVKERNPDENWVVAKLQ